MNKLDKLKVKINENIKARETMSENSTYDIAKVYNAAIKDAYKRVLEMITELEG